MTHHLPKSPHLFFLATLASLSIITFPGLTSQTPASGDPETTSREYASNQPLPARLKEKTAELFDRDSLRVPIILYHHIRPITDVLDSMGKALSVTPERFGEHLAVLKKNGFTTITLEDFADAIEKKKQLPPKPIIITLDDGYDNAHTYALPILERLNMGATVLMIAHAVGTPGYLRWEQLEDMADRGVFEIQSHTLDHSDLARLSDEDAWRQILDSKNLLESRLGLPMTFFCYPYGAYTQQTAELVKKAGYRGALTTHYGLRHSAKTLYETPRVRFTEGDTGVRLEKKVRNLLR